MRLEDLMERASQYDETLARDIKDYVHGRKYGLVYEASKPEFVRMWKKPVVRGDLVNILPPRGEIEDTKSETDPAEVVYKVINIVDGIARLREEQTGEEVEVAVDDVVALTRFDKPIYAGLKEVDRVKRGGDKPYHVLINGENYHALQTLVYVYQGMVDCIYIDPPYNTGAKDWKYNNNYVGADDIYRHSKWLTFMEDRLKLAKKLLKPDNSILVVTIDEKEYLRLGLLLEQLFPEARIQMVSSVINRKGVSHKGTQKAESNSTEITQFSRVSEYIYFVMLGNASIVKQTHNMLDSSQKEEDEETDIGHVQWLSMLRRGSASKRADKPKHFYPIFVDGSTATIKSVGEPIPLEVERSTIEIPDGCVAVWPMRTNGEEGRWQLKRETFVRALHEGWAKLGSYNKNSDRWAINYLNEGTLTEIKNGFIEIIGKDEKGAFILSRTKKKLVEPKSVWNQTSHNSSEYGTSLLNDIIGSRVFDYPKSLYAVQDTLKLCIGDNANALVVDFFAGSATTLHAVCLLNLQDKGSRRCICVTNNEVSATEAVSMSEQKLRPGDKEWDLRGIAKAASWPRVKCVIEGIDINGKPLKGDYGCTTEAYQEFQGDVIDPETGKKKRKKLYEKIKKPAYPEMANNKMSDGFEENAIFFDLEYLEPTIVNADLAFDNIAPILWLCGGCKGEILARHKGYVIGETYAVLFDPRYTKKFVDSILDKPEVSTVFIVTDAAERYRSLCAELPGRQVMQLYESYLRSFEINAIG